MALALGKTLDEIDALSLTEFNEWFLLYGVEPFGDRRGDIQAAIVAKTMADIHRSDKTQPYKLSDFMLDWNPKPAEPQTVEEQKQIMQRLHTMLKNRKRDG